MTARSAAAPIRYAVIGQGYISQTAVLPAFAHATRNSVLTALVSDEARKRKVLGKRYGIDMLCSYEDYDTLLASGEIDAVYIALPNHMHCDFTVRAARAGVHVLCEKPLAVTEGECREMIAAAKRHKVKLMTAYRLHLEAANLAAIEAVASDIGEARLFTSSFTMQVQAPNIRLEQEMGGGTLYDIGIYCINAARHLFRAEPTSVFAMAVHGSDKRFREVEEMACATLLFPGDRLATFACSFGAADTARFQVVGTEGTVSLEQAYEIGKEKKLRVHSTHRVHEHEFARGDQFAPELLHFSDCILEGRDPTPSGEEGLSDVRIIAALYRSARSGKAEKLAPVARPRAFTRHQAIRRPAIQKVPLVGVKPPSKH